MIACYDIALQGGPAPRGWRGSNRGKQARAKRRRRTRKEKKEERRHGNRRPSRTPFQQDKQTLKTVRRQIGEKRNVRFNMDAYDDDILHDNDVDTFIHEGRFDYDDDDSNMSSGWD